MTGFTLLNNVVLNLLIIICWTNKALNERIIIDLSITSQLERVS